MNKRQVVILLVLACTVFCVLGLAGYVAFGEGAQPTPTPYHPGDSDDMIEATTRVVCSPRGFTGADIAFVNGYKTLGVMLGAGRTIEDGIVGEAMGCVAGCVYAARSRGANLEAAAVIVNDTRLMFFVRAPDVDDWGNGRITDKQFISRWILIEY